MGCLREPPACLVGIATMGIFMSLMFKASTTSWLLSTFQPKPGQLSPQGSLKIGHDKGRISEWRMKARHSLIRRGSNFQPYYIQNLL